MKISYSNYPILEKLQKGSLGTLPVDESDYRFFELNGQFFSSNWEKHSENFKKEINIISNTFNEASIKADKKLIELWGDILKNDVSDFDVKGCYICGRLVFMIDYEVKKGSDEQEIFFYIFNKDGIPIAFYIDSAKNKIYQNGWISNYMEVNNNREDIQKNIYSRIVKTIIWKMFKNYAEVETKIIQANTKINSVDFKCVNDTKLNMTYLDSKWFTNLVKSEGFNVRGHFRLQPKKKNGDWTKELIWISEFQKNGYTAQARILSTKTNQ